MSHHRLLRSVLLRRSALILGGLVLAMAATGCAGKAGAAGGDDVSLSGGPTGVKEDAGSTDVVAVANAGELGAVCTGDSDCKSLVCDAGVCAQICVATSECGGGRECITDNATRSFCHTPTHPDGMGLACYMGQSCAAGLKCLGDDGSPRAVCTHSCKTGLDCPTSMECAIDPSDATGKTNACRPRRFCSACVTDEECGAGRVCSDMGLGAKFCTKTCDVGSFECPRYADCTHVDAEDRDVCTHRAGTCIGDGTLCQPCADDLCASSDFQCLTFRQSGETFCTNTCTVQTDCGDAGKGYKCTQVDAAGTKRCIPSTSRCVGKLTELYKKGDIFEDYAMLGRMDTNGDGKLTDEEPMLIHLSDFADKQVIAITISAGWCQPCQAETHTFASTLAKYGDKAAIFQILIEDDNEGGGLIDLAFSLFWIKQYGAATASGIDPDGTPDMWNLPGSIPLNILLDAKTRKILEKENGATSDGWNGLFAKYVK